MRTCLRSLEASGSYSEVWILLMCDGRSTFAPLRRNNNKSDSMHKVQI